MLKKYIYVLLSLFLITLLSSSGMALDDIREPKWAGKFYPQEGNNLVELIESFTQEVKNTSIDLPDNKELKAIIVPHAGYSFSAPTAAYMSIVLENQSFDKVIVLGPDHRAGFKQAVVCQAKAYKTPLGLVYLHEDAYNIIDSDIFLPIGVDQSVEHSIEVILPFLQYYLPPFRLVPIVIGTCHGQKYLSEIQSILHDSTLLVVSTDLSHYLKYAKAKKRDKKTIEMIVDLQADKLQASSNRACGSCPLSILLHIAEKNDWQPVVLNYSNSGDTSGAKNRVVGYATIAFFGESNMVTNNKQNQGVTGEQGQSLVKLARQTIGQHLKLDDYAQKRQDQEKELTDDIFQAKRGIFVTLKKNGQLRGCIGSLVGTEPIIEGVKENAVNAAFKDPRFPPLSTEEFAQIDIEVSVLSEPKNLNYSDGRDLINKLQVNVDGVILKKGMAQATFLPQVWEQLPHPEEFLSHLCLKAGLSSDTWKKENLEVMTYQVQSFEEK